MKKVFKSEVIDYNTRLCQIIIETDPCKIETLEGRNSLLELFRHIITEPSLISYKDINAQKIEIIRDSEKWILTARFVDHEKEP